MLRRNKNDKSKDQRILHNKLELYKAYVIWFVSYYIQVILQNMVCETRLAAATVMLWTCILQVPCPNLVVLILRTNTRTQLPCLVCDHFLLNPFQFITHQSSYCRLYVVCNTNSVLKYTIKRISAHPGLCPLTNCGGRYLHWRSDNTICSQCDNTENEIHMKQSHKISAKLEERDGKACDKLSARSIQPQSNK